MPAGLRSGGVQQGRGRAGCLVVLRPERLTGSQKVDAALLRDHESEDSFDRILETNVAGTYNLYEAARQQGCPRVVFASSLHVTGFYDASERISPQMPVRPDSFYGVSKACGESLGRLYADKHGLQVVCVRIGTFAERPTTPRHLSTWLSPRDAVELFWRCLVAPDIGFIVVYGTSATRRGWWDPGPVEQLGYRPMDDAEAWAAEVNSADADPTESRKGPQGAPTPAEPS
jgi:uronate dehydrogenase